MMKPRALLALAVLAVANSSSVHALDCRIASLPVEKLICSNPELKQADEAMSAAYFKLLRATADPDFRAALIRSQRRWSEIRARGVDSFGAAQDGDHTDDRQVLLKMTRDRLTRLQTAEPIRMMEQQRKLAAQDGGGAFAGYESDCFFSPPPYGGWGYECHGSAHRQHNERICSLVTWWASGHTTEYRLLSVLRNGEPKPVASCSEGYESTTERCPEPDDDAETKKVAHWNTNPRLSDESPTVRASGLWKYDADYDMEAVAQPWMHECLFSSTFPPPEMSRSDTPRKK